MTQYTELTLSQSNNDRNSSSNLSTAMASSAVFNKEVNSITTNGSFVNVTVNIKQNLKLNPGLKLSIEYSL